METIVVTRHSALVEFLRELGVATGAEQVYAHATEEVVRGKRVIGVLPLHLAAAAASIVVVGLNIPAEDRGRELSIDDLRRYYTGTYEYEVSAREVPVGR